MVLTILQDFVSMFFSLPASSNPEQREVETTFTTGPCVSIVLCVQIYRAEIQLTYLEVQ